MILSKLAKSLVPQMRVNAFGCFRSSSSSQVPKMPDCQFEFEPFEDHKYHKYDKVKEIRQKHLAHQVIYYSRPILMTQGRMQWLWDSTGKRYLDMFGGIVTVSVGHCHPKVNARAKDQIDRIWHTTSIYKTPPIHEYAEKLASKMPGNLKVCFFTNSGSEANDMAIMMARVYTGAFDIISFRNAYHGASPYNIGLTAQSTWKFDLPGGFGVHHAMNPDPYRGIWGGSNCRDSPVQTTRTCDCAPDQCAAKNNYIDQFQDCLNYSCGPKVAGFFAESIQGVGGSVQFPRGFLQEAFERVRAKGGLCISDEVQTGFGRTGTHMWGFEGHGVMPDIVTMAKGIGNGIPMAAVVTTPEIAAVMKQALHFNTFGGNPISCAVSSTVLDVMEEENTQKRSKEIGTALLLELGKLRNEYDVVGDVRGKGLMIGIEMVKDKESRTPLPADEMNKLFEDIKEMGVLLGKGGYFGNVFRIKPPMCITKEDCSFTVAVIKKALDNMKSA